MLHQGEQAKQPADEARSRRPCSLIRSARLCGVHHSSEVIALPSGLLWVTKGSGMPKNHRRCLSAKSIRSVPRGESQSTSSVFALSTQIRQAARVGNRSVIAPRLSEAIHSVGFHIVVQSRASP